VLRPWRLALVINEANALGNGQHLAIIAFRRLQARTTGGNRVGLLSMPMWGRAHCWLVGAAARYP
jgi:hypothetical protein